LKVKPVSREEREVGEGFQGRILFSFATIAVFARDF